MCSYVAIKDLSLYRLYEEEIERKTKSYAKGREMFFRDMFVPDFSKPIFSEDIEKICRRLRFFFTSRTSKFQYTTKMYEECLRYYKPESEDFKKACDVFIEKCIGIEFCRSKIEDEVGSFEDRDWTWKTVMMDAIDPPAPMGTLEDDSLSYTESFPFIDPLEVVSPSLMDIDF